MYLADVQLGATKQMLEGRQSEDLDLAMTE
jgi:hypothetical protein